MQRDDGSYLISGWMPAVDFAELLDIELPTQQRPYQTFAGFLLQEFGKIPDVGEHITAHGWRFEIMDLDGRRIDKAMASKSRGCSCGVNYFTLPMRGRVGECHVKRDTRRGGVSTSP